MHMRNITTVKIMNISITEKLPYAPSKGFLKNKTTFCLEIFSKGKLKNIKNLCAPFIQIHQFLTSATFVCIPMYIYMCV